MASDLLKNLRKNRGASANALKESMEKRKSSGYKRDERLYKPKFNKEKGGNYAIIRFLPSQHECDPIVELLQHSFDGPTGLRYWQNSRNTLFDDQGNRENDPCQLAAMFHFMKAKATEDESYKDIAKTLMPKTNYYANIYVIKDAEQPERQGTVCIYQFGRQINEIVEKAINPTMDIDEPIDPFDLWEGHNFQLKVELGKNGKWPTYENSKFEQYSSELFEGDDEAKVEVYQKTYDLNEFIDPKKIKPFDELAEEFKRVFGQPYNALDPKYAESVAAKADAADEDEDEEYQERQRPSPEPKPKRTRPTPVKKEPEPEEADEDGAPWDDEEGSSDEGEAVEAEPEEVDESKLSPRERMMRISAKHGK